MKRTTDHKRGNSLEAQTISGQSMARLSSRSIVAVRNRLHRCFQPQTIRIRSSSERSLQIDRLESRDLFAVVAAFVYQDFDGNGQYDSGHDQVASESVVYLDVDRNGSWQSGEPFGITDVNGKASISYSPEAGQENFHADLRLLGNHYSILTSPAAWPTQSSLLSDHAAIALGSSSQADQLFIATSKSLETLNWKGGSSQIMANWKRPLQQWIAPSETADGYAIIAPNFSGSAAKNDQILRINRETGVATVVTLDSIGGVVEIQSATRIGKGLLALASVNANQQLLGISDSGKVDVIEGNLGGPITLATGSNSSNGVFVESLAKGSKIHNVAFVDSSWSVQSTQLVPEKFDRAQLSPNGKQLVVQTLEGNLIAYQLASQWQQLGVLPEAAFPIAFDSTSTQLLTSSPAANRITNWQRSADPNASWVASWNRDLSDGETATSLGVGELIAWQANLQAFAVATNRGVRSWRSTGPSGYEIDFANLDDGHEYSFGRLDRRTNLSPRAIVDTVFQTTEDQWLELSAIDWQTRWKDADGDQLLFAVEQLPSSGALDLNPSGQWKFSPNSNFNGSDRFIVRAYDGRSASEPVTVPLLVTPVPDAPVGLQVQLPSISENVLPGEHLGSVTVLDPDGDGTFNFELSDDRFEIKDGWLQLASNSELDFEKANSIPLTIRVRDTDFLDQPLVQTLTVTVVDVNDAPSDVLLDGNTLFENSPGATVGTVTVVDEDTSDSFQISVTDPRFVVDHGALKLLPGVTVDFERETEIRLTISATDRGGQGATIERSFVISVLDRNDPPSSIVLAGRTIQENTTGAVVGPVYVVDQDSASQYDITVSDPRFTVEGGILRLRDGQYIMAGSGAEILVTLTATDRATSDNSISQQFLLRVISNPRPWQNPVIPHDVNGDGHMTPVDVLIIINHLNRNGAHPLGNPFPGEGESVPSYYDVNGDGNVTPIDALIVINYLNQLSSGEPSGEGPLGSGGNAPATQGAPNTPVSPLNGDAGNDNDPLRRRKRS